MNQSARTLPIRGLIIFMVFFLTACGQTGPLVLPEPKTDTAQTSSDNQSESITPEQQ